MSTTKPQPWYGAGETHGKWCRAQHAPESQLDDRACYSESTEVPLSFLPGTTKQGVHEPEGFLLGLHQEWREVEPHIAFDYIQGSIPGVTLTLDEAERLAFTLTRLVDAARDGQVQR